MKELESIKKYVSKYISLTEDEEKYFLSVLTVKKIRKKQNVVQPDFTCKCRNYIVKGAMRAYYLDDNSQEHTITLAIDDWWISDFNSYIYQQPATLFVEALEDTIVIQIEYTNEQLLLEKVPKFERFFRIITQYGFAFLQRRLLSSISKSAEERYETILVEYPLIAQRVPQFALASYLGMSTEYLSKLRNNKVSLKKLK
ncbi:Crp/Fnr family transcriptional regulator [Flavobacterium sp. NRK1]|uniref:Crp/Fnr family transcriptional regulator n=1 Tax=Flavobacterium sp. NRK1 TaxID=2954929 RepID=UPI002091EF8D|nr:Crp/Fnr family transcriptional regulator [Flavobacterium sp. NRK1]MCO6147937.1 Crp/Fnr family transcriptional regulator [Flavobacterium sp. NRK1]